MQNNSKNGSGNLTGKDIAKMSLSELKETANQLMTEAGLNAETQGKVHQAVEGLSVEMGLANMVLSNLNVAPMETLYKAGEAALAQNDPFFKNDNELTKFKQLGCLIKYAKDYQSKFGKASEVVPACNARMPAMGC